MKIHIEIWIAAQLLSKEKHTFTKKELTKKINDKFDDRRRGVSTHISSYCVASTKADPGKYRYLTRIRPGLYRVFKKGDETHPTKKNAPLHPDQDDIPVKYHYLLEGYLDHPFELRLSQAIQNREIVYDFQKNSIKKIVEAAHTKKHTLISIATGLGKTHIIVQALKQLLNDNLIKYSLILTTRNVSLEMYSNFLKNNFILTYKINPKIIKRIQNKELEKCILLSTIQSYMNFFSEVPKDFFNIIILDECHLLTQKNWEIINEQKSTKIGFTFQPSTLLNENLFTYFNIKKPVVSYGLESIKLKEIAYIFRGANYRSTDLQEHGTWKFLRPRDVQENNIINEKTFVTKDFVNKNQNKILKNGDIILQNIFDFEKISLVEDHNLPAIASNNFYIIRSSKINPKFLFNYLQSSTILEEFQRQLDTIATGAIIKRIRINDLKEIFVPIPISEEQINWFIEINNYDQQELIEIYNQVAELKRAYKEYLNEE